jgi:hypothetical protein
MAKEIPVARLTLVVEFDNMPEDDDINRIIDEARSTGAVRSAEYETLKLVKRKLA